MNQPDGDGFENRATASNDPAASFEARFQRLLDLTGLEPDDLVELDDDHEEHKWSDFVQEWARDPNTLDTLQLEQPLSAAVRALLAGSDRLQRKTVAVSSGAVLEIRQEQGRTRRVRGVTREKLRHNHRP